MSFIENNYDDLLMPEIQFDEVTEIVNEEKYNYNSIKKSTYTNPKLNTNQIKTKLYNDNFDKK